jgi:hypothetical protein
MKKRVSLVAGDASLRTSRFEFFDLAESLVFGMDNHEIIERVLTRSIISASQNRENSLGKLKKLIGRNY